ncbi:hypothetical protein KY347_00510 [Candidatus Woesearchaeota archaeon]|nr:hypothetical protein [Candidatus Woesearchaeota archaeon]
MNLEDLAFLTGRTRKELEEHLKQNDVIELDLNEKSARQIRDKGGIEIL